MLMLQVQSDAVHRDTYGNAGCFFNRGYLAGLVAARQGLEAELSREEGFQVALAEILASNQALRSSHQAQQVPPEEP